MESLLCQRPLIGLTEGPAFICRISAVGIGVYAKPVWFGRISFWRCLLRLPSVTVLVSYLLKLMLYFFSVGLYSFYVQSALPLQIRLYLLFNIKTSRRRGWLFLINEIWYNYLRGLEPLQPVSA